jgi:hypothetical protein
MSSQLRKTDISLQGPNSSLEFYLQYRSLIRNIPLPYRTFSSSDYNDKIDESVMSKNVTLDSERGSMMAYYLGDLYNRSSNNRTQFSAKTLNRSGTSSRGEQVAEEKRKRTRMKRDSESSSQVNRRMKCVIISSLQELSHTKYDI